MATDDKVVIGQTDGANDPEAVLIDYLLGVSWIPVGVAACAVCCAGPILAILAAIGLGTAAGFALFGTVAVVVGAMLIAFVAVRRHRRAADSAIEETPAAVTVELTGTRSRS